jgi:hypothetical protein
MQWLRSKDALVIGYLMLRFGQAWILTYSKSPAPVRKPAKGPFHDFCHIPPPFGTPRRTHRASVDQQTSDERLLTIQTENCS